MARPSNILISTIKRNQRLRGPTSSEQQNDMQAEVLRDLTVYQQEWNNKIVPLCSILPDGSDDLAVDAFLNGLDGRTVYVNAEASNAAATVRFYNLVKDRPNTVYEQLQDLYATIDNLSIENDTVADHTHDVFTDEDDGFAPASGGGVQNYLRADGTWSFPSVMPTTSVSINTTLTTAHYTLRVDASGGSRTITLPLASSVTGRIFVIKKIDSTGNTVVLDANGSELIDGQANQTLASQYAGLTVQSNGTGWDIL